MKRVAYAVATVLLVACSGDAKDPGAVRLFVSEATAAKARTAAVDLSASQTAMVNGEGAKSLAVLAVGRPTTGALTASDPMLDNGKYFDLWEFQLSQESDVTLSLTSGAFDTYLVLMEGTIGSPGDILGDNDDANGSTNSELWGTLTAGTYTAVASSYGSGVTGDYQITLATSGNGSADVRTLTTGVAASGALTSGDPTLADPASYFHEWSFYGHAGDSVTISLASREFDTVVGLLMSGQLLADNDDSNGTTDSRVSRFLPWSGMYTVVATSYGAGMTGTYSLSLATVPRAPFAGFRSGGSPNGRYALLVGISDYPGDENDLIGPDDDARLMQALLVERFGFDRANIVTLQNEDATRTNIARGIAQHLGQAGPNGVAVLYYSGHGAPVGENVGITGSLDVEPSGQDQVLAVYGTDDLSVLLDEELGYLVESLEAGRSLVIIDACFSGSITRGRAQSRSIDLHDPATAARVHLPRSFITGELRALNVTDFSPGFGDFGRVAEVLRRPQRHLMWSAATDEQKSWTSTEFLLGAFTTFLERRLRSEAGTSTFAQVHRLVHDDVARHTGNDPAAEMELQNPQLGGDRQSMTIDDFFRQR
jgi:hypothetical protein